MSDWINFISNLKNENRSFVIITLVNVRGSSPQSIGAKAIVDETGLIFGTIGGGKLEARAIIDSKKMLQELKIYKYEKWNLQKDIGMTCGGVVDVSFESVLSVHPFKVCVFGAGHVAQELIRLLLKVDGTFICVDPRLEWLDRLPSSNKLLKVTEEKMENYVEKLTDDYFVVSLTMGNSFDRPILSRALKRNFKFVGTLGSKQKRKLIENELIKEKGIQKKHLLKLICPIGESFGSNAPFEIALSIMAQILKNRDLKN